jgi:hypothetical protein
MTTVFGDIYLVNIPATPVPQQTHPTTVTTTVEVGTQTDCETTVEASSQSNRKTTVDVSCQTFDATTQITRTPAPTFSRNLIFDNSAPDESVALLNTAAGYETDSKRISAELLLSQL